MLVYVISQSGQPLMPTDRCFKIRTLDGTVVNNGSINCKKIQLVEKAKYYLTEIREEG